MASHTDCGKYDFETYMRPIWEGQTVYNEIVMFYPNGQTGVVDPAPLLYTPQQVISVRSYDLQTVYEAGVDYTVENGCIARTPQSRIPAWEYDEYYPTSPSSVKLPSVSLPGRYYVYGPGALFAGYQVCVTYTHTDTWNGPLPTYEGDKLPRTAKILADKGTLNVVYYGPSGTAGKEASGLLGIAPYMPRWTDLVTEKLERATGATICGTNTALSGKRLDWGLKNVEERVNHYAPDLLVLNFGGNEGSANWSCQQFKTYNRALIDTVREKHPACEVLFVTPYLFNPDEASRNGPQAQYQTPLKELAAELPGIGLVNMTEIYRYLLTKKRYGDLTGNNVNHNNDFYIRLEAQAVSNALIPPVE